MKMYIRAIFALAAVITLASCAKQETESANDIQQKSFEAWMEANVTDAIRYDNGIYIKWLTQNDAGQTPEYGNWLMLNYTGKTLVGGDVYNTRYAEVARNEGTFTLRTNYVPQFINFYDQNGLTFGENFALTKMKTGEKVIVYMPSKYGYNGLAKSFTNGYGGHYSLTAAMIPLQVELELVSIFKDASERDKKLCKDYAASVGMGEDDEIKSGLYAKILTQTSAHEDSIVGSDATAYIFLTTDVIQEEGTFLVDTNIPAVAQAAWKDYTPYGARSIVPKFSSSEYIAAFKETFALLDITWESSFRMVMTSEYAYSSTGNTGGDLKEPYGVVQPFTPLVIDVYVQKRKYKLGDTPYLDGLVIP